MKLLCLFAVAAVAFAEIPTLTEMNSLSFEAWGAKFSKLYGSAEERLAREVIYKTNQFIVTQHNAANHSWTMALNEWADLTPEEFSARLGLRKGAAPSSSAPHTHVPSGAPLADSIDWRTKNAVTEVKNQGGCGSCWAFSTVVSLEGQAALKSGNLTSFSEQDLVDCVKNVKLPNSSQVCCDGCMGGLMDYAFAYMIKSQHGEDDTEAAYPYRGVDGKCKFAQSAASPVVKSYTDVKKNEDDLKDAVGTVGPISIGVDASIGWQLYFGGVMDPWPLVGCSPNPKKMDHGVAVVGYGSTSSKDYWIIRNSWGSGWGEKGYMRLVRGKNACGITNNAVYPNL